jgi:hypothetical protein
MAKTAVLGLRVPEQSAPLDVSFFIPPQAAARRITLLLDGKEVAAQSYPGPGAYTLHSQPLRPNSRIVMLSIAVDATFHAPGDARELGIVLLSAGFAAAR